MSENEIHALVIKGTVDIQGLVAIAIMKSVKYQCVGAVYGFASDAEKLSHYEKWFDAEPIGILHQFHFLIADKAAVRIVEEYNYEWSDDEL